MKTLSALIVLTALSAVGVLLNDWNTTFPTPSPHFIGVGDLPGGVANSTASAVSADGTVVGCGYSAAGLEAFRWTPLRGMEGLGFREAFAVSADGSIVVGYRHIAKRAEPVRWTRDGGIVCLRELPDYSYGSANGVSADGSVIVGAYGDDNATTFRWILGRGIAGLPRLRGAVVRCEARAISADGAVVVGESRGESGYDEAFRFHADTGLIQLGVLPGDLSSVAHSVSADGSVIVGSSSSLGAAVKAFRWTQRSGMIGLGTLPEGSRNSQACGVSADGSIIVGQCYSEGGPKAFIWDAEHGMRTVRQVLASRFDLGANLVGWKLQSANAVSADGSFVVGHGTNPSGDREAWLAYLGNEHRPVAVIAAKPAIARIRSHE